jgi:hypothetical protein
MKVVFGIALSPAASEDALVKDEIHHVAAA